MRKVKPPVLQKAKQGVIFIVFSIQRIPAPCVLPNKRCLIEFFIRAFLRHKFFVRTLFNNLAA